MDNVGKVYALAVFYEELHGGVHVAVVSTDKDLVMKAAKRKLSEFRQFKEAGNVSGFRRLFEAALMLTVYDNKTGDIALMEKDGKRVAEAYFVAEGEDGEPVLTSFVEVYGGCREQTPKQPG